MKTQIPIVMWLSALSVLADSVPERPCDITGEVFGVDVIADTILVKSSDGYIQGAGFNKATVVRNLSPLSRISAADITSGDLVCVRIPSAAVAAGEIDVMPRIEVEKVQRSYLRRWVEGVAFGKVLTVDNDAAAFTMEPGAVRVQVSPQTAFRTFLAQGEIPAPAKLASLQAGDQVYVRGRRMTDGQLEGSLVLTGGYREIAATILSIDALSETINVRTLGDGARFTVHVAATDVFQTLGPAWKSGPSPAIDTDFRVPGRFAPIGFADLQPGDSLLIVGHAGRSPSEISATGVLARFGYFRPSDTQASSAPAWFFQ